MSHSHNLSVNSINSIIEPTTPPKTGPVPHAHSKSALWDSSNRLNHQLNLPNFNIEGPALAMPSAIPPAAGDLAASPAPAPAADPAAGAHLNLMGPMTAATTPRARPRHSSRSSSQDHSDKENQFPKHGASGAGESGSKASSASVASSGSSKTKIDKEYLASINKVPLSQLKAEILKLSKDQYGCRFLQKKIDENLVANYQARLSNFEIIFKQIHPYLYELIIDPFGNYLIQKLINYCNEENLNLILEILQYNLFQISINQHGTRALQKIIDNLNNQYQLNLLIKGLKPYIIELIKDLNGNHVIQKILNKYQPKDCQFIYDSIIEDLYIVATHKHGCCVLQKCLNHVTLSQLQEFSSCILNFKNFQLLINDQFGNYVLQYLISINSLEINYKIFENFVKYGINNLCNLKFSSNVIEKFLKNCYNNEVCNINFSNLKFELIYNILISELNKLINDPYGNYVIQTLVDILVHPQVNYLEEGDPGMAPVFLAPKLTLLLPPNYIHLHSESLQILIIKYWFQNCKIISSFGKRIQSKINIILNNSSLGAPAPLGNHKSKSRSISIDKGHNHMGSMSGPGGPQPNMNNAVGPGVNGGMFQQNMNSNGEFTVNESFGMGQPMHQSYRSLSISSTPSNLDIAKQHQHQHQHSNSRNLSLPSNFYTSNITGPGNFVTGTEPSANGIGMMAPVTNQGPNFNSNDYTINEYPFGFPGQGTPHQNMVPNGSGHHYSFSNGSQADGSNLPFQHPHQQHQHQVSFSGSSSSTDMNANGNGNGSSVSMGHKHQGSVSSLHLNHPQPLGHYTTSGNNGAGINLPYTPPPAQYQQPPYYPHYQQQQQPQQPQNQYKGLYPGQPPAPQQQFQQAAMPQHMPYVGQAGGHYGRGNGHGHNLSISSTSSISNGGMGPEALMYSANPLATNYYQ